MKSDQDEGSNLRRTAEARLSDGKSDSNLCKDMGDRDPLALVHELSVHQIELEMQNEELKRAKLETDAALTKYSDLYDFAPLGLLTLDAHLKIVEVNLAAAEQLGMERRYLLDKRLDSFIASGDRAAFDAFCRVAFTTRVKQKADLGILKSTGEKIQAHLEGIALDRIGTKYSITVLDITDRKRAEEELRESEERFRDLAENMPDQISRFDRSLRLVYANAAVLQRTGLPGDELVGRTASEYGETPEAAALWEKHAREVMESGQPRSYEHASPWHGETQFLDVRLVPEKDADGSVRSLIAVVRDITDRKRDEERLRASLAEKDVLLKEIHHRVKNNMQVISSLISLQASRSEDAAARQVLADLRGRVRTMALVHEKLYLSPDISRVDFAEYARSLLHFVWQANATDAVRVELRLDLEPLLLSVEAAVPCGLILNELATNTLKHAFRGREKGVVTVSLHAGADGRTCLKVSDNGIGLPADLDWQQPQTLGLQLVKMLTRQLNGTVDVRSGGGTEFRIAF